MNMQSHSAFCASVSHATLRGLDLETHVTNAVQVRTSPSLQEVSSAGLLCPEGGGGALLPPPLFIFPSQGTTPSSKTHNEALTGHPLALSPRSSPALLFPVDMSKATKQSPRTRRQDPHGNLSALYLPQCEGRRLRLQAAGPHRRQHTEAASMAWSSINIC